MYSLTMVRKNNKETFIGRAFGCARRELILCYFAYYPTTVIHLCRLFVPALILTVMAAVASCGGSSQAVKPERRDLTEMVFASGTLEPLFVYHLTAQSDGVITSLGFEEGDTVRSAQLLGTIDNKPNDISAGSARQLLSIAEQNADPRGPLLKQAEQNTALLRQKMKQDSIQWQRYEQLFAAASTSKVELERNQLAYESSRTAYLNAIQSYSLQLHEAQQKAIAQRSQRDIQEVSASYSEIRAVMSGRVYKRLKEQGDFVRRGELLAVIGHASQMRARLSVDESNIGRIRTGQSVLIRLNTNKSESWNAVISEIAPAFDEQTQSFTCKADFVKQPGFRIYGTQLQANIVAGEIKNALVIPRKFYDFNGQVHVKGKGPVHVETGIISTEWVQVLSGLEETDELVKK
jgi:multidrug efflux pump subunit AcrA (membrane-fusion protein)